MEQRRLGSHGPLVSALGLGCMGMSGVYGTAAERDPAEAMATLAAALDLGITLFDTAEVYGPYANELLLGRALARHRERCVVATKFGFRIDADGGIDGCDGSPANARRACEASLLRLRIEAIDLYYLHRLDPQVPIEETVGAMADLVREGKVRYLGLSEVTAATLARAVAVHPITALQSEYSLFERGVEAYVLPACRTLGVGFVPFAPLGRGFLAGAAQRAEAYRDGDFRHSLPRFQGQNFDRNQLLVSTLEQLAARKQCTPAQLALAWLLAQGADLVPIPGASRPLHLAENSAAAGMVLAADELTALANAFPRGAVAGARYAEADLRLVDRER